MSEIVFDNVVKSFGDVKVLDGVSFSVEKGEILSIVGPSGTGKSVTLKHIVGLIEPDSGNVTVRSDRIGYLFQSGALMAWLTVAENVALPLVETTSLSGEEIDRRVAAALSAVGLSDAADKYPEEISGGMKKRAGMLDRPGDGRRTLRRADVGPGSGDRSLHQPAYRQAEPRAGRHVGSRDPRSQVGDGDVFARAAAQRRQGARMRHAGGICNIN